MSEEWDFDDTMKLVESILLFIAGVIGTIMLATLTEVNLWARLFLIVIGWFGAITMWEIIVRRLR